MTNLETEVILWRFIQLSNPIRTETHILFFFYVDINKMKNDQPKLTKINISWTFSFSRFPSYRTHILDQTIPSSWPAMYPYPHLHYYSHHQDQNLFPDLNILFQDLLFIPRTKYCIPRSKRVIPITTFYSHH